MKFLKKEVCPFFRDARIDNLFALTFQFSGVCHKIKGKNDADKGIIYIAQRI